MTTTAVRTPRLRNLLPAAAAALLLTLAGCTGSPGNAPPAPPAADAPGNADPAAPADPNTPDPNTQQPPAPAPGAGSGTFVVDSKTYHVTNVISCGAEGEEEQLIETSVDVTVAGRADDGSEATVWAYSHTLYGMDFSNIDYSGPEGTYQSVEDIDVITVNNNQLTWSGTLMSMDETTTINLQFDIERPSEAINCQY